MTVSAIIPTFNRRAYIRRAVDSVLAQTVPVMEILIVDDERSTDRLEEAVAEWYGNRVRVVKAGGGLSGARHAGVKAAEGDWIAFLDSDDEWTPERNADLVEAGRCLPADVAWLFGDMRVVTDYGDDTTLFGEYGLKVTSSQVFPDSLTVQYPFMFGLVQASLIRRHVLVELNCFQEGLRSSEDLLAAFQVACRYKFAAIPAVVGRRILTSDLRPTSASASANGILGPDYHRARMLAFALVFERRGGDVWRDRHAEHVRGYCKALAKQGAVPYGLPAQQFRFGAWSWKAAAFFAAGLFGRRGILAWDALTKRFRRRHGATTAAIGHRGWAQSLADRNI